MVSIEEALRAWLLNDPTVGPMIGATPGSQTQKGQVYKESIPEECVIAGGLCAIAYDIDSEERERSLSGVTTDKNARVKLTLEAMDEATLNTLIEAVAGTPSNPKLDGMTTEMLGFGATAVWCQYLQVEDRPDDFVPQPHGGDEGTFLSHMALRIAYVSN